MINDFMRGCLAVGTIVPVSTAADNTPRVEQHSKIRPAA